MSKLDSNIQKPSINIGTLGHVDHGKTTLVKALTGVLTSRHSQELARNITIKLGYATMNIYKCNTCEPPFNYFTSSTCPRGHSCEYVRSISFIDAPGHEVLMTTMLSGAALMDGALFVIAADEKCPQPQTREHLYAAKILGLKNIIVVQNKIDLVTKERAKESYKEIRTLLSEAGYDNVPIIPVSATFGTNIDALVWAIEKYFPTPRRDPNLELRMPVIRSFNINKPGTLLKDIKGGVIGGSIQQGKLKEGDEINIFPGVIVRSEGEVKNIVLETRVLSIMFDSKSLKEADPGGLIAVGSTLDPSLTKDDRLSGSVVTLAGRQIRVTKQVTLEVNLFSYLLGTQEKVKVEPIKLKEKLNINIGVGMSSGEVQAIKDNIAEIKLDKPLVAEPGQRAAVSRLIDRRWRLIGYGVVR